MKRCLPLTLVRNFITKKCVISCNSLLSKKQLFLAHALAWATPLPIFRASADILIRSQLFTAGHGFHEGNSSRAFELVVRLRRTSQGKAAYVRYNIYAVLNCRYCLSICILKLHALKEMIFFGCIKINQWPILKYGTLECRNAGTPERRNTKTRNTKLLKPGTHEK